MPDLIDPASAVASVTKEISADQLRWKSLVHSVAAGDPQPPARIVQRLGTAFDLTPGQSTAAFLEDVSTLKKFRQLSLQQVKGETAMQDWIKIHESPEKLKAELEEVQNRSVEIRTALSKHWQRESANAAKHWQLQKMQRDNTRIF